MKYAIKKIIDGVVNFKEQLAFGNMGGDLDIFTDFLFVFKDLFIYMKGRVTERQRERERERERGLPSTGSLRNWLQLQELHRSKARSFLRVSHMGAGA